MCLSVLQAILERRYHSNSDESEWFCTSLWPIARHQQRNFERQFDPETARISYATVVNVNEKGAVLYSNAHQTYIAARRDVFPLCREIIEKDDEKGGCFY